MRRWIARAARDRRLPYLLLALVVVASLALRVYKLEEPCPDRCTTPAAASLIWDEAYYVNAARRIADIPVPDGQNYHGTPAGQDPNAEHPQLAKLVMAGGLELFGNRPLGWRFGSLLFGTLALVLLFAVVRAAGGSPWLALAATAVMASDNLALVHGRIATLDIYALAFMLGCALAYLRGLPVVAGVVLGLGLCVKLVCVYLLFVLGLVELLRRLLRRRELPGPSASGTALAKTIVATGVVYLAAVSLLGVAIKPYDPGSEKTLAGPVAHTRHMLDVATSLVSPEGATGAASRPWDWITGGGEVDFLRISTTVQSGEQVVDQRDTVAFRGAVNPFLILLALPALFAAAAATWRRGEELDVLVVAWFAGLFVAFCAQSLFEARTMYIHYLLVVMPALYLGAVRLAAVLPRAAATGWGLAIIIGVIQLYPFREIG